MQWTCRCWERFCPPGVQDRREAEVAAEMARIAPEGGERLGDGPEEEGVEPPGVALSECVQGVRQREDHVEVGDGEQVGPAGVEPALLGEGLAFRAMAVATGVVGEAFGPAGIASFAMAAEGGGTTAFDGVHGAALGAGQRVGLAIRRPVGAEDIGHFDPDPVPRAPRRVGRGRRPHGLPEAAGGR